MRSKNQKVLGVHIDDYGRLTENADKLGLERSRMFSVMLDLLEGKIDRSALKTPRKLKEMYPSRKMNIRETQAHYDVLRKEFPDMERDDMIKELGITEAQYDVISGDALRRAARWIKRGYEEPEGLSVKAKISPKMAKRALDILRGSVSGTPEERKIMGVTR
ncbi:hypothetical protein QJV46_gp57 [Serratia phage vB_SmaS_Opt-155]|uniref:Uncharacterized protein n=1 Tax=Serratia phage vB_SmaS_Opt-155 TaxID=2902690 RepID=A0AC61TQF3_9CAUD|nr:hypothetical protein QJV46_gp57 [Serratia phage vB_SmaS_Opt-155]UGO52758.1 hypothetical protein OPT155_57 [Serratia phage vB_SmaS_Opt-155]